MDLISDLIYGFQVVLTPINLLYLTAGAMLGMIVGIIPGFGPAAGLAILLPVTFNMDPVSAIVMLAAIYYGSMYGGTISAILLNAPGESATVASTFDGYPMAKQGRAGPALVMQAVASFVGGTVGVVLITLLAPFFGEVTKSFGPPEIFLLAVLGILTLVALMSGNWRLGILSALIGFALGTVGVDLETGQQRFTFGSPELIAGVYFIPVAIGLFGLGELFHSFWCGLHDKGTGGIVQYRGEQRFWPEKSDWQESKYAFPRGSILGFVVGVIPGAGATIASLMAYTVEKQASKTPEKFGKGAMAGLVGPEAANNAASAGAMIPLLTLGIPGSASTAVLLAAFLMWGLRPGPLLMTQNPDFAWGLIASMYLGNMALLAVNIFAIPLFVMIVKIPYRILAPIIVLICTMGTFSVHASMVETWIMGVAGIAGFLMKLYGLSPAAVVLALVLGPMAEEALRQTLTISGGSFMIFLDRPMSLGVLSVFAVIIAGAMALSRLSSRKDGADPASRTTANTADEG